MNFCAHIVKCLITFSQIEACGLSPTNETCCQVQYALLWQSGAASMCSQSWNVIVYAWFQNRVSLEHETKET